jgi:putative membrane protein
MSIIINWIISALAILVAAYLLPGVHVDGFIVAMVLAVVLGLINAFVRPVLLFFTLPINIVTLGLFTFVINALMIMLAAYFTPGFTVASFWWALLFSLILALVNWLLRVAFESAPKM